MEALSRRRFLRTTAAATLAAAAAPAAEALRHPATQPQSGAAPGFRGTLAFFSKHLPGMDARRLGRTLKALGFGGVDLTVRPGGHVAPEAVAEKLPLFVSDLGQEGMAVPMITTGLVSAAEPTARPILETAARLRIRCYKPGYYKYAFADVRKELQVVAGELRELAALSTHCGIRLGYHNHAGYVGGPVWDIAGIIDTLDPAWVGYYFDVRHAVVEGGDGGWRTALNLAAPRLVMVALKDFFWEKTAGGWEQRNCPMGAGMVNWPAFFAALAKSGFDGPLSLHLEYDIPGATAAAREESTVAAASRDLAFVKARLAEAYPPAQVP